MPFNQTGNNSSAHIGTYHDVAGDQTNYNNTGSGTQPVNAGSGKQSNVDASGGNAKVNTGDINCTVFFPAFSRASWVNKFPKTRGKSRGAFV